MNWPNWAGWRCSRMLQALSRYSVSEADYARWQSTRLALRPTAPHIDTVTIAAGSDMAASLAALKPATGQPWTAPI